MHIKRNWHSGRLEADIVSVEGRSLIVTEVKTRHRSLQQNYPAMAAITIEKRRHLERIGQSFLRNNGPLCRRFHIRTLRIDTVEVYYERGPLGLRRPHRVVWHRGLS